jgi:hypothetical protein
VVLPALGIVSALAWAACCAIGVGPAAESSGSPEFVLHLADGSDATGPLEQAGPEWSIRLGGTSPRQADGGQVISVRRAHAALPPPARGEQVIFANGDRLPGEVQDLVGERLRLRTGGRDLILPLSAIAVIWLGAPDRTENPDRLVRQLAAGRRKRDLLLLRNGDVMEGLLTALNRSGPVRMEVNRKNVAVEFAKVAAVALNTQLTRSLRPRGPYARLVRADGSRLGLASAAVERQVLRGRTLFGTTLTVPLEELVALDVYQGPAVYLSDLKPTAYEFTPYLGSLHWHYSRDGSVVGRELRLAGSTFDKGLGVHSASSLTYGLAGAYRRFEALVGLDDQTGAEGSVRVRLLVDGKPHEVGGGAEITRSTGPAKVALDVAGARELTLVVEFGRHGDVQDHVDWADARLIK